MAREITYQALIIKRQPYGEADEILTVFTRQAGKLRVLAKSVKYSKSKLRSSLQTLFLINLTTTSAAAFPKAIRVEVIKTFARIRENLEAAERAFYALELLVKFTADEHKNERLFDLVAEFLEFLDSAKGEQALNFGLAKFKIEFLDSLGLGIHYEIPEGYSDNVGISPTPIPNKDNGQSSSSKKENRYKSHDFQQLVWGFSNVRGGFLFGEDAADSRRVPPQAFSQFLELKRLPFSQLSDLGQSQLIFKESPKPLQELLSSFIKYHLERDINSEKFLGG